MSELNTFNEETFLKLLSDLTDIQLSDQSDEAEIQRLQNELQMQLKDNQSAQQLYLEYCQLQSMLAWEHGSLTPEVFLEQENSPKAVQTSPLKTSPFVLFRQGLGVAASIAVVGLMSWLLLTESGPTSPAKSVTPWETRTVVGRLKESHGADIAIKELNLALETGDELKVGHYELRDGFAQLAFENEIEMVVEAPASFEVKSASRLALHRGRLAAKNITTGKQFVIETDTSEIVDLAEDFAVDADPIQGCEVHVFRGHMVLRDKKDPTDPIRLNPNQAMRITPTQFIAMGIDIDHDRFVRDLEEPQLLDHQRLIKSLDPVVFLRMSISEDGKTLENKGSQGKPAFIRYFKTHNGKPFGRPIATEDKRPPFAPGKRGSALRLNGAKWGSYAVLPEYPMTTNGKLTVCAWVRADSRPRWAGIARNWTIGQRGQFHFGLYQDIGHLEVHVWDETMNEIQLMEKKPLPLHTWQHVAFVSDGNTLSLYRNGELVDSAPCQGLSTFPAQGMGIGTKLDIDGESPGHPIGFWHGRIDELAVFHHALSQDKLREIIRSGNKPQQQPFKQPNID